MKILKKLLMNRFLGDIFIIMLFMIVMYLMITVYFMNHFFFNTVINGIDFSLKAYSESENIAEDYLKHYELQLIERSGSIQKVKGQAIRLQYNQQNSIAKICKKHPMKWITSLFINQNYVVDDLFLYDANELDREISHLNCLKTDVKPQNVSFQYLNGSYLVINEVEGNMITKEKLEKAIKRSVLNGDLKLNLSEKHCYEEPKYTINSNKTTETLTLLNKYVSANINYKFDCEEELLTGDKIHQWIVIDENLDVVINESEVMNYVKELCRKYDTVGKKRNFKTSTGKIIEVEGGLYGWKIDWAAETEALLNHIELGEVIKKEPIYSQRALSMGEDEFGDTYLEVNITKQHLWFYKNGELVTQGAVVTGNPNKGNSTLTGVYMLNYKQKGATLRGVNYASKVTYWMPFFGNIGIHDANWRHSFGGQIYKRNGTHGCINTPLYLAEKIYDNIEEGVPIIIYIEE